jgi:Mn-dependent DtxR family transcriptional regulator
MSLTNGDEIKLSIAPSAMQKMIMELIATGYLTTEELAVYVIGQLKLCDAENLSHVLPQNVMNKLNETYQAAINGGNNV